ncbi:hypothetical protein [Thermococcus sp.]
MRRVSIIIVAILFIFVVISLGCIEKSETSTSTSKARSTSLTPAPPSIPTTSSFNFPEDASPVGNLSLELKAPSCVLGRFNVMVTITNVGNNTVLILKPINMITLHFRLYSENGSEVKYLGPVPTYLPLKDQDAVVLRAEESLKKTITLDTHFWRAENGTYILVALYDTRDVKAETSRPVWRGMLKTNVSVTFGCS